MHGQKLGPQRTGHDPCPRLEAEGQRRRRAPLLVFSERQRQRACAAVLSIGAGRRATRHRHSRPRRVRPRRVPTSPRPLRRARARGEMQRTYPVRPWISINPLTHGGVDNLRNVLMEASLRPERARTRRARLVANLAASAPNPAHKPSHPRRQPGPAAHTRSAACKAARRQLD